jgi:hypothetical protein
MNKKIETYQDLLDEKVQLETLVRAQKDLLMLDLQALKSELRPALRTVAVVGKMFTREKDHSLLGMGTETLIDLVFKKVVLNKAGWIARFIVPILAKNVSSHILAENKQGWLQKLRNWVGKKSHNGKTPPEPGPAGARPDTKSGQ